MRYRLDVVAANAADAVKFAGGWMYDRVMAGWDVTVLLADRTDERPLQILGVETSDLESALALWADRPHPQTVAVAADLFATDERVRRGVLGALEQGLTEVTLWGDTCPPNSTTASARCAPAQRGRPRVQEPGADRRRRRRLRQPATRDVPLRCDGDAVGRRGSHSGELRSISTLPTALPSATWRSARARFGERVDRADVRRHPAGGQQLAQFGLVAGELVGGDVLELEAQHMHTLDQNEVERECAGSRPRRSRR